MKKVAIIAALPGELKSLVEEWQQSEHNIWAGTIHGIDAVAIAGGIGAAAAERAVTRALAYGNPDAIVSYGWAGALTCAVKPPAACVINEVVEAASGESFATASADGYRLITLDHVAHVDEKRGLAAKFQSVIVDMEAATVARASIARGIPFYCFKGISDGYTDRLPDFSRFIDTDGQLRMGAFLAHVASHPQYWPALTRLSRSSREAASELSGLIRQSLSNSL